MTAIAPQPLLSPAVRAGGIAAALAIIAVATAFAERASEDAVRSAQAALSPAVRYMVLQPVEVVASRNGAAVADACKKDSAT